VTFVDWADLTRWKLINKELDLPFDEPLETYSTSDHLFHDLGIPRDAKGRLRDPDPKPPRSERSGGDQRRGQNRGQGGARPAATSGDGSGQASATNRNRNRRRNRTRGGAPVQQAD